MFFMVIFVMKIHSICVSQFKKKNGNWKTA
jgi:hypothetical protein